MLAGDRAPTAKEKTPREAGLFYPPSARSFQFGRASAPAVPQFPHTMRDENEGTRIWPGQ
jgi:hypothetical protein